MKRLTIGVILALVLVLATAGTTMAAPFVPGEGGQLFFFGSYEDWSWFGVGGGFILADGMALGVEYYPGEGDLGVFGHLYLPPILIAADYIHNLGQWLRAAGYYVIGLDPLLLGLGGGIDTGCCWTDWYLGAVARLSADDNFGLYGAFDYYPNYSDFNFEIGVTLEL